MLTTSINSGVSRRAYRAALLVKNPIRAAVKGGVRLEAVSGFKKWSDVDCGSAALHTLDGEMPRVGITPLMDRIIGSFSDLSVEAVQGYQACPQFSKNGRSYVPGPHTPRRRGEG